MKKKLQISCGSKTFIVGEYLALSGGATVLASLNPRFELKAQKYEIKNNEVSNRERKGLSQSGPVAELLNRYASFFDNYELEFIDPYLGKGGFGASTAQILTLIGLEMWERNQKSLSQEEIDFKALLHLYWSLTPDSQIKPSGADIMVQARGGFMIFDRLKGLIENYIWPFQDLELGVFATGIKLATHEHLKSLPKINTEPLLSRAEKTVLAIKTMNSEAFVQSINEYRIELEKQSLTSVHTNELMGKIKHLPEVLGYKGCGAMGCDSFLVVGKKGVINKVSQALGLEAAGRIPDELSQPLSFRGDL